MKKILYVEDNEDFSESFVVLFQAEYLNQYEFCVVKSCKKAIELLHERKFDLIIYDLKNENNENNDLVMNERIDELSVKLSIPLVVFTGYNEFVKYYSGLKNHRGWVNKQDRSKLKALMDGLLYL